MGIWAYGGIHDCVLFFTFNFQLEFEQATVSLTVWFLQPKKRYVVGVLFQHVTVLYIVRTKNRSSVILFQTSF